MLTDSENAGLRRAVYVGLTSDPRVSSQHIHVSAERGSVTLSGYVSSNAQKEAACVATRRVKGVHQVTDTVAVAVPEGGYANDEQMEHRALLVLTSCGLGERGQVSLGDLPLPLQRC